MTATPSDLALKGLLEPHPAVLAAWLGGSAATGRLDALSDTDLVAIVQDGAEAAVWALLEGALPIEVRLELPLPTWHGHQQRIYRVAGKLLDVVERSEYGRIPLRHTDLDAAGLDARVYCECLMQAFNWATRVSTEA